MTTDTPLIVTLPHLVKAELITTRRRVFFETSREGVEDRQGEDVAADALWACRQRFLKDGNLDINHYSWLGNPYGSGARPEYVIGHPTAVERDGKSIYVEGDIFANRSQPPAGSNGDWADWFWHSLTEMNPPMKWYASVFGTVLGGKVVERRGRTLRYITRVDWFSVGFAQRPQHPDLKPVSTEPVLAKAAQFSAGRLRRGGAEVMSLGSLAKAMTVGQPITDSAAKTGVQALKRSDLSYKVVMPEVLRSVLAGKVPPRREHIAKAFATAGCDAGRAREYTERLLLDMAKGR